MKGLSKIGHIIKQIVSGAGEVLPIAKVLFPKQAGVIDKIDDGLQHAAVIVANTEAIGDALKLPGADKLTAATPPMVQLLLDRIVLGRKIDDPALFNAGATAIASGMAQVLNSLHADSITVPPAGVPVQ